MPFLPVCCSDRAERVLAVRVTGVMVNLPVFFYQDLLEIAHYVSVRISSLKRDLTPKHNSEGYRGVVCELVTSTRYS